MKTKKFLLPILMYAVTMLFTGCPDEPLEFTVGVVYPDASNAYHQQIITAMEAYDTDGLITVYEEVSGGSPATEAAKVSDLIQNQGVDYVVVIPASEGNSIVSEVTDTVAAAVDSGIPLIFILYNPYDGTTLPEGVYFSGFEQDHTAAGALSMDYLANAMNHSGNLCIITGPVDHESAIQRTAGYQQILNETENAGITVLKTEAAGWDETTANNLVDGWLGDAAYDDLDAIICNNDSMAFGALDALTDASRTGILVVGFDGVDAALTLIEAGTMLASVSQSPKRLALFTMGVLALMENGETVDSTQEYILELITASNVSLFK